MEEKPKVFIASSSKALPFAGAVQRLIKNDFKAYVWKDVPKYTSITLVEWILHLPERYDFGIFIFSGDDNIIMNDERHIVARDNVLFELGLFAGKLGFDRCSVLRPDIQGFHLPSDLNGIFEETFENPAENDDIISNLRTACDEIMLKFKAKWKLVLEERNKIITPERVAAICYRKNDNGLYEFLLVRSSSGNRFGFPKQPYDKSGAQTPIESAIEIARKEGGVLARKAEGAPNLKPFKYKKESDDKIVNYTPFLLEVYSSSPATESEKRVPEFFTLGDVFKQLRSNRFDDESIKALEKIICQCYNWLLGE